MPAVRIKICGITRVEDALAAAAAGADAIGLVFYAKSPRAVDIHRAREIVRALPPFVTSVGLFVNASRCELGEILDAVPLDLLQFHGDERAEDCEGHRRPYLKALRMKPGDDIVGRAAAYPSRRPSGLRKTNSSPNSLAHRTTWLRSDLGKPLVLAGGLTPDNVGRAVEQVKPYAVDVSGGVEASKGIKDAARVRAFVDAVRSRRRDET
ncbi:phosphoribosylanthranilate isomerase [Pseudomonas aeruginosa]|uniref:phosphoribosylanthranilate isomerase n=1 Tax=Pseudomonas aeruginosa TaxID=287 RepID=UPI0030157876